MERRGQRGRRGNWSAMAKIILSLPAADGVSPAMRKKHNQIWSYATRRFSVGWSDGRVVVARHGRSVNYHPSARKMHRRSRRWGGGATNGEVEPWWVRSQGREDVERGFWRNWLIPFPCDSEGGGSIIWHTALLVIHINCSSPIPCLILIFKRGVG